MNMALVPCERLPLYQTPDQVGGDEEISPLPSVGRNDSSVMPDQKLVISSAVEKSPSYKENIANALSRGVYERLGL